MSGLPRLFLRPMIAVAALFFGAQLLAADTGGENFTGEEMAKGRRLFTVHCARCHGMQGLGGTGPNLVRPTQAKDYNSMLSVIALGIPGTAMPPWRMLAKKDQRVVAG